SDEEKLEALNAHPAIGATGLPGRSAAEQGAGADPAVLTELAYQNQVYEEKFGFRFVVFVNRRSKAEILDVLRGRLERTREEELDTRSGSSLRSRRTDGVVPSARPVHDRLAQPARALAACRCSD